MKIFLIEIKRDDDFSKVITIDSDFINIILMILNRDFVSLLLLSDNKLQGLEILYPEKPLHEPKLYERNTFSTFLGNYDYYNRPHTGNIFNMIDCYYNNLIMSLFNNSL